MSSSRIHSLFTMTNSSVTIVSDDTNLNTFRIWWSQTGSNRRPEACKATALPTELWPHCSKGSRATGRGGRSALRAYRLEDHSLVGLGGLEPPTSRLSSARSNQLSYRPKANRSEIDRPKPGLAQNATETSPMLVKSSAFARKEKEKRRRQVPHVEA